MALVQLLIEQNFPTIAIHAVYATSGEIVPLSTVQGFPKENFGCHQFMCKWLFTNPFKHFESATVGQNI